MALAVGASWARSATSALMAASCAWIGARIGEPGRDRARLAARSRPARSSSRSVRWLASWSRMGVWVPDARALVLLGYHLGELLLEFLAWLGVGGQSLHGETLFECLAQRPQLERCHLRYRMQ